jgi:hypothetical protein
MFLRTIAMIGCCLMCAAGAIVPSSGAAAQESSSTGGTYKGKTRQGRAIVFTVVHGWLDLRRFSIRLACRDGSVLIDEESGFEATRLPSAGTFHEDQAGSTDEVWFRGRANAGVVRGRVRVKDRVGHVRCDSRWVKFTARARGSTR